ncbi:MAG: type II secretion system GspH family protein [Candidatus Calescibacterium sp.]|nr:type II secretion system GspH family protein [Candidatus Calescibacterium sp.]
MNRNSFSKRAFTLAEVLVGIAIVSFILTAVVQFIIFYNHLKRAIERISDITTQADLISKKINNILYETPNLNNTKIQFQESGNIIIKKLVISGTQKTTISAIGFYDLHNNGRYWVNETFINNKKYTNRIPDSIYPEYRKYNNFVILTIYAELYSTIVPLKISKPQKVSFGTFFILLD